MNEDEKTKHTALYRTKLEKKVTEIVGEKGTLEERLEILSSNERITGNESRAATYIRKMGNAFVHNNDSLKVKFDLIKFDEDYKTIVNALNRIIITQKEKSNKTETIAQYSKMNKKSLVSSDSKTIKIKNKSLLIKPKVKKESAVKKGIPSIDIDLYQNNLANAFIMSFVAITLCLGLYFNFSKNINTPLSDTTVSYTTPQVGDEEYRKNTHIKPLKKNDIPKSSSNHGGYGDLSVPNSHSYTESSEKNTSQVFIKNSNNYSNSLTKKIDNGGYDTIESFTYNSSQDEPVQKTYYISNGNYRNNSKFKPVQFQSTTEIPTMGPSTVLKPNFTNPITEDTLSHVDDHGGYN